jgi:CDP-2,3-bis-(O-geranylgeranyl)-sn-glycerol synthase
MNLVFEAIWWILPAYIANAVPVLVGGGAPLDFGKNFSDGRRILGPGKTIRGAVIGFVLGSLVGLAEGRLEIGVLLAAGAIFGDAVASFVKRRIGIERGQPLFVIDQLDFVLGALVFGAVVEVPRLALLIAILVITPLIHLLTNWGAYKLKIKKGPW